MTTDEGIALSRRRMRALARQLAAALLLWVALGAACTTAWAQDSVLTVSLPQGMQLQMVWVEGGSFTMGSNAARGVSHHYEATRPEHPCTVSSFYIGRTEVTQALWTAVMGENPSLFRSDDSLPVEQISWNDAQLFVTLLSQMTGLRFRLPTEAEWEYAARGGKHSAGKPFAGCSRSELNRYGWFCTNSQRLTHRVASLLPNELGLYDMAGNVAEWCSDWLGDYDAAPAHNPRGAAGGEFRVLRGGHYNSTSPACTVYDRSWYVPDASTEYFGLRLALDADN